jgi:hypothetical protein
MSSPAQNTPADVDALPSRDDAVPEWVLLTATPEPNLPESLRNYYVRTDLIDVFFYVPEGRSSIRVSDQGLFLTATSAAKLWTLFQKHSKDLSGP